MSTVVVFNVPFEDHITPTLPIVTELARRGERVIYYATARFQAAVEATGALYRPYPQLPKGLLDDPDQELHTLALNMLRAAEIMLPELLAALEQEPPDFVLFDSTCVWGWYAAKLLHLPAVACIARLMLSPTVLIRSRALFPAFQQLLNHLPTILSYRETAAALAQRYTIPTPGITQVLYHTAALNLVYTSAAFHPLSETFSSRCCFIGPLFAPDDDLRCQPPDLIYKQFEVYLRPGHHGNGQDLETLLRAVLRSGALPALHEYHAPRLPVLLTNGSIHHVQAALASDMPLVIIPQTFEQQMVARRAAELGVGIVLDSGPLSAEALAAALRTLSTAPHYQANAHRIGSSLRTAGGVAQAVEAIQQFKRDFGLATSV